MSEPIILWFRQDLRLADLPALQAAACEGNNVVAIYVHDEAAAGDWAPGGASRWWLHHSLDSLASTITDDGGQLILRSGDTAEVLQALCDETGAKTVHCSRRYEPWAEEQEKAVHATLEDAGLMLRRYPGTLLHEPGSVVTKNGDPYKVFTPFWRACRREDVSTPLAVPDVTWHKKLSSETLDDWELLPTKPNWAEDWKDLWQPGEDGASKRLVAFLDGPVEVYGKQRDLPAEEGTSRLSPHLHHGELSPRQVWAQCEQLKARSGTSTKEIEKFQSELGWREFSYHLLHFFPTLPEKTFKENFADFPWSQSRKNLEAWQKGNTGYPIVDAGMRELWNTGYMHNRVRMIVASFLCKHLLIHWREGEDWFWDTLVDADMASNGASWQWVAGSGADAAPYFRIFNPMTQGEKFDGDGDYVRHWVPEIAGLPDKHLHTPWEAPEDVLEEAGVELGKDYPEPMVDHREARQAALDAYDTIKVSNSSSS